MKATRRLTPPLRQVFRAAYRARDAKRGAEVHDERGDRVVSSRRSNLRLAISEQVLRSEVAIDIEMLMNTVAMEASTDMSGLQWVRRSILNFGLPDFGARSIDEASVGFIADEVRAALILFEPRLEPSSIAVRRTETSDSELRIRFHVSAYLKCDPVAVPVEFLADIETQTSDVSVRLT